MSRKKKFKKTILYEASFTPEQEVLAEQHAMARSIAWNYALKKLNQYYEKVDLGVVDPYDEEQYFDFNALSIQMTQWRKNEPTVSQAPRFVMGAALIDLKNTHWNHLRNICGRPQFKDLDDPDLKKTFELRKVVTGKPVIRKLTKNYGKIRLSNEFKWVKIRLENEWQNPNVTKLTVRKFEDGIWRIIIVFDTECSRRHKGDGSDGGIDIGSNHAATTNKGKFYDVPQDIEDLAKKLRDFDSMLDKKQKGSNRYKKLKRRKNKLSIRKTRKTKGWVERVVYDESTRCDTIYIEDINLTEMAEGDWNNKKAKGKKKSKGKRTVNRKMKQANLGLLRKKLAEKTKVVKVPAEYTSQDCPVSTCGHRSRKNRKDEKFECEACGRTAHADINAAQNILKRGRILSGALPGHIPASVKERIHQLSNGLATESRLAEALETGRFQSGKLTRSNPSTENPKEAFEPPTKSRSDG